jgi:predicted nucleotide-binding protein
VSRSYINEDGDDVPFKVFLTHGRSELWRSVERFINKTLDMDTVVLKEQYRGCTIVEKLEDEADDCDCAVIVMTPDDKMENGTLRSRQNVIHEIGYLQALYSRHRVVILKEDEVEFFSNNFGVEYIEFTGDAISATFHLLREALNEIYQEVVNDEREAADEENDDNDDDEDDDNDEDQDDEE